MKKQQLRLALVASNQIKLGFAIMQAELGKRFITSSTSRANNELSRPVTLPIVVNVNVFLVGRWKMIFSSIRIQTFLYQLK